MHISLVYRLWKILLSDMSRPETFGMALVFLAFCCPKHGYSFVGSELLSEASWSGGTAIPISCSFGLLENCLKFCLRSENFCLKMQILGLKNGIWGKFRGKIGILSTRNLQLFVRILSKM